MIQIPDCTDYFITTTGQVFSSKRGKLKQMKGGLDRDGYHVVCINCKSIGVHRLVAITFIPNPNNYPCVCHKDDNPSNNDVNNLFWGTKAMNNKDRASKGRTNKVHQKNRLSTVSEETKAKIKERRPFVESVKDLANEFGLHFTTTYRILKEKP